MCKTMDILKLLNISLPSPSTNNTFNWLMVQLPDFYTEHYLAQSKRYHQMMSLLR